MLLNYKWLISSGILLISCRFSAILATTRHEPYAASLDVESMLFRDRPPVCSAFQEAPSVRDALTKDLDLYMIVILTLTAPGVWKDLAHADGTHKVLGKNYTDPGSAEHLMDGIEQDGRHNRSGVKYLIVADRLQADQPRKWV